MRNRLLPKLKSRAGESLIESLVAILIFTMASIVMYSMVTTSANINQIAKEKDANIYAELLNAEMGEGTPFATEQITMTITVTHQANGVSTTETKSVGSGVVSIYGNPDSTLYAYYDKGGN